MPYTMTPLPDLVVPNGGVASNIMRASETYADAEKITIIAGVGATAGTIEVSHDGVTFVALQSQEEASALGTAKDVASPVASKARTYEIVAPFFRIACAVTGAIITYKVFKRLFTN